MVIHYLETYKYIPLWVLIRILSFGKVSRFYSIMKQDEFYNLLIKNIELLKKELFTISIDKVMHKMGLTKNYKKLLKFE